MTIFDHFASKIIGQPAEDLRRSREFDETIFQKTIKDAVF